MVVFLGIKTVMTPPAVSNPSDRGVTSRSSSQSPESSRISTDILLVFPLEFLNKVVHHSVVKILTSKMGISSSGFHLKDTLLDGKKRYIKSTTTQIKNQHILLPNTCCLLVKTISNGSSSGLVDNTHNIQPSNNSSVLCGLSLRVIEVSRDSNHGVLDSKNPHENKTNFLMVIVDLVNLLNLRTCTAATSWRSIIIHAPTHVSSCTLIHLGNDWIADALKLLHLVLKLISLGKLVAVQPLDSIVNGILNLLLVIRSELGADLLILYSVPHVILHLLIAFTTQDSSLDCSTICNSLIRVDALAELLSIKEVLQKLLHLGNSSRATNKNNIMNRALVHLSIPQTLLYRLHTLPEEIHVHLLKSCTSNGGVKVNALIQRVNLNGGLSSG
uniref:Uncharacterized protein n=1 Tax=Salix viminalis TaxID=40686 RepID=A0A6N2NCI3_SALVM